MLTDAIWLLRGLPSQVVLLAGGVLIAAEAGLLIGVLLPGASVVLALGVLANLGVVAPTLAVGTAATGAVFGTQVAYLRGRRLGPNSRSYLEKPLLRATDLLRRAGPLAFSVCQWLVGTRTIAPRLAARAGISYPRFATVSVPAAAVWGASLVVLGYLTGEAYQTVSHWLSLVAVLVLAVPATLTLWRRFRAGRLST